MHPTLLHQLATAQHDEYERDARNARLARLARTGRGAPDFPVSRQLGPISSLLVILLGVLALA